MYINLFLWIPITIQILTGLEPDLSGADSLHISGCTPQLVFDAATSIATNGRIPISEDPQIASGKGKFQPDNRNGYEKYNDNDDDEWFLGLTKKGMMCTCNIVKF